MKNNLKIAIIGANLAGLACALECEKKGIIPDIFERYDTLGWAWPSVSALLEIFTNHFGKDILEYFNANFGVTFKPLGNLTQVMLKSPNEKTIIKGNLGYLFLRGKSPNSLENEMFRSLMTTPVHFNRPANYAELSKKYDYVVIADGKDSVGKELGVWEDAGHVNIITAFVFGSFMPGSSTIYFNTEYCGTGYVRITPFDPTKAILGLYVIGEQYNEFDLDKLLMKFIEIEKLSNMEIIYKTISPKFFVGRVSKFQIDNILLTGRAAGLTERVMGEGGTSALISGFMAARAIIKGKDYDYDAHIAPLKRHIENISSFRQVINKFANQDFDRLVSLIGAPGIKQVIYNSGIDFVDLAGFVLKNLCSKRSVPVPLD